MSAIGQTMRAALEAVLSDKDQEYQSSARQFEPEKRLCERDYTIIDMLNSKGHESVCFCVCDPDLKDMPIIFSSDGFCDFTGYSHEEIEGKNCRFLQGTETSTEDVDRIRKAIKEQKEECVNLLNYRKDGSSFINEFFISPLLDDNEKLAYFIGVQCSVPKKGPGQMPSNAG
mmetsp:Transcript_388/g.1142  ORF Transcript_388/g.1142 Transcript_388/m.1142 type:complete len:172 (+) Transcript_388:229-744(+)